MGVLTQLMTDITSELSSVTVDITGLLASISALYGRIVSMTDDDIQDMMVTISAAYMFVLYVYDTSNPSGFDLFYSDDGVTWLPYTVNGLGDSTNYGGRVIIPTEYGLMVLTANPFTGCQVWNLNDTFEPLAFVSESKPVRMDVGGTATFFVRAVGLDGNISVTVSDGSAVSAKIEIVGYDPTVYVSTVEKVFNPAIYGSYQWKEEGGYGSVYRITLTGLSEYSGTIDLVVSMDGHDATFSLGMDIDKRVQDDDETDHSMLILMAAVAIVCILVVGTITIIILRR
jgi:hypothetical protein